ncbi:MAG: hypothetical protein WC087_02015 [Candidatus Paceibacterota bacterium]
MSFLFNKKSFFVLLFLFTIFLNPSDFVFAQDAPAASETPEEKDLTEKPLVDLPAEGLQLASPVLAVIAYFFSSIAALVLGIASYGFDLAIDLAVYGMSDFVTGSNIVQDSWKIFRNIANIGIIFVLIFIAISTILQFSGYEAKKLLSKAILAALLMNFSFFFGAVVIDISNEMALTIYDQIKEETDKNSSGDNGDSLKLGSYFYEKTQVAAFGSIMNSQFDKNQEKLLEKTYSEMPWYKKLPGSKTAFETGWAIGTFFQKMLVVAVASTLSGITSLVLAAVLFSALSIIIGRLVALILLLIVSPIAFASMVLPNTKKISEEWWRSLVGHSFFLPAFLLFIYVAVKIAEKVPENVAKITENALNNTVEGTSTFASVVNVVGGVAMIYGIIIGLFVAALIVAQKVSSGGSAAVSKISGGVSSAVGGTILGTIGFAGRNTVGWAASAGADKFAKSNFATTRAGMTLLSGMKGVAKSGFDLRESKVFKGVASATGVGGDFKGTLAPTKDGYIGQQERSQKLRVDRSKNLSDGFTDDQKEAQKQAKKDMEASINSDDYVVEAKKTINELNIDYEAAKSSGDSERMKRINTLLSNATQNLSTHETRVRDTDEYKALEKVVAMKSQRMKHADNLEGNRTKIDLVMPTTWLPSAKSIDKKAAGEIMKAMSTEQKQLKDLKKLLEGDDKKPDNKSDSKGGDKEGK